MPQRRLSLSIGRHWHDSNTCPLGFVRKEGGAKACFSSTRKGALAFFGQRALGNPIRFLSCPHAANPIIIDRFFWGLLSEKESPKSYPEGLRGGFFCCFEVYRTAIIYNNNLCIRILQIAHKTDHVIPKKKNSTSLKSGKWSINQEVRRIIRPFPS